MKGEPQVAERDAFGATVALVAVDGERFHQQWLRVFDPAFVERERGQKRDRPPLASPVARVPSDGEPSLEVGPGLLNPARALLRLPEHAEREGPVLTRERRLQHSGAEIDGHRERTLEFEHRPRGPIARDRRLAVAPRRHPPACRDQVVELGREGLSPLDAAMTVERIDRVIATEPREPKSMTPFGGLRALGPAGVHRDRARFGELLPSVFLKVDEHPETHGGSGGAATFARHPRTDQALLDERLQHIDDPRSVRPRLEIEHSFGGPEAEPSFEDRALREGRLLPRSEEIPRAVDRRTERGVPSGAAPRENAETLGDPIDDLRRRHDPETCRGKLDRERDPIHEPHQLSDRDRLGAAGLDRALPASAFHEKLDATLERKRFDRLHRLSGESQPLAARHDEHRLRRAREPRRDGLAGKLHHLLEVVEDDAAAPAAGDRMTQLRHDVAGTERDPEPLAHSRGDSIFVLRFRQIAEPHSPGPLVEAPPRVADRESCLPDAARAEERHQARASSEPRRKIAEFLFASDEGVALRRQAVRHCGPRRLRRERRLRGRRGAHAGRGAEALEERALELARGLVASAGIGRERPVEDSNEALREVRAEIARVLSLTSRVLRAQILQRGRLDGKRSGDEGEENDAQGVQIAPGFGRRAAQHLRRHEVRRAGERPLLPAAAEARIELAAEPEIHEDDAPSGGAHDVRQLHVLMDDSGGMHGGEGAAEIDPDERRLAPVEDAALLENVVERLAAQELGPDPDLTVDPVGAEDRHDVGIPHERQETGLAHDLVARIGDVSTQDLERDLAVEPRVARTVDRSERAGADTFEDFELAPAGAGRERGGGRGSVRGRAGREGARGRGGRRRA